MDNAKRLLIESLKKWQYDIKKFKPTAPQVFKINSSILNNPSKITKFLKELNVINGSCIYRLLIQHTKYCTLIRKKFDSFQIDNKQKDKEIKRYVSRFMEKESKCLYVGSKRENIEKRIKQHLGYDTAGTYSLDLKFWFPQKIEIMIEIYPVKLDNDLLVALEQKMWVNSRPMFGKQSGL